MKTNVMTVKMRNLALGFLKKLTALLENKTKEEIGGLADLKIKIEEFPNKDIISYYISDPLTDMKLSFTEEKDLQYGGLGSLNLNNVEVPEELQYLAGAFLTISGLMCVNFSKHEIRFEKSPVFDWSEMENDIMYYIKALIAKKRSVIVKERVRMGIDASGRSFHTVIS